MTYYPEKAPSQIKPISEGTTVNVLVVLHDTIKKKLIYTLKDDFFLSPCHILKFKFPV